jgi:methyltransferase FkbM-like protein
VQQKQLDSIIRNSRPTVAKLDVEGYEEEVLRGGRALLVSESFQVIQLETVTPATQDILSEHQFQRAFYDPFRRLLSTEPVGYPPSNALFIKDFGFVNGRIKSSPKVRVLDSLI